MFLIKKTESVLVAIAIVLLAGVITYNVLSSPPLYEAEVTPKTEIPQSSVTTTVLETTKVPSEVATKTGVVNINTAGLSELETLTGIGETKAQAIIDYRTENGNFSSVKDLTKVQGIGEKTLAKIIDNITV